jgi:hypothetical protein
MEDAMAMRRWMMWLAAFGLAVSLLSVAAAVPAAARLVG